MKSLARPTFFAGVAGLLLLLAACGGGDKEKPGSVSAPGPPAVVQQAPVPADLGSMVPLKVEPGTGFVGDQFTISGEKFAPSAQVEFQWRTVDGVYINDVAADNVSYIERKYLEKRLSLGRTRADSQGRISFSLTVPEDHGENHDIFAVVDGQEVGRGGYRILRNITVTPLQGPIGTPITITVTGMASSYYQSTMAVRWDNEFTGFISTVTTDGTGIAQIRASGPRGEHTLQVFPASHAMPYLNSHEGPNWQIFGHLPDKFVFKVTKDSGAPANSLEFPDPARVAKLSDDAPRTAFVSAAPPLPNLSATVSPASGPILTQPKLQARGLPANTDVELVWVTARGNRATTSGWSLSDVPLTKARTGTDGALNAAFEVPDDLGGWHSVKVMAAGKLLAEAPYYVERSLVGVTPKKVKAGETFSVQIKGIGWTELDNGVAVTYDNGYVGMACGFNSNGNITLYLAATGGPGTHLIDLYPMIYEGHPNKQVFNFNIPQLTALRDSPGLALGYRLPIYRLAIEVAD